jgi:hypothetical protein
MFRKLRDDEGEKASDEAVSQSSVNFEQKSRNLSKRVRQVSGPGVNLIKLFRPKFTDQN